ncbi:MAG TPA: SdrD B-like domain-containing protein, partial [Saprospiraceae bacterium]|nr:SdrD B-like domain-containing protein [Saprospiraceae bacterium]
CSGGNPAAFTVTTAATGSGVLTYQWQSGAGTDCNVVSFSNIAGATSATYDAPAGLTVTTLYRRITTSTLNGVACTATSNCVKVTINDVTPGTIAADQAICNGGDPAAFTVPTAATGSGVLTYQWQSGTGGCGGSFSDITGATSATYDAPGGLTTTTTYRRITTSTLNGVNCTATSNCVTVTVYPLLSLTLTPTPATCNGASDGSVLIDVTNGVANYAYNWTRTPTGTGTGSGITIEPFTVSSLSAGTYTFTVTDGHNCTATGTTTVIEPSLTVVSATPSLCNPANNQYSVAVVVTWANAPTGTITVVTDQGGSATLSIAPGSSGTQTITITGMTSNGVQDIDVTARFTTVCFKTLVDAYDAPLDCRPATIGDYVWNDLDGDGIQDAGEPGIPGVTVTLTGTDQLGVNVTQTTTTDGSGFYLFQNLVPGTYKLTFTKPSGYFTTAIDRGGNDALDSDADLTTGMTVNEVLSPAEDNRFYDAGYWQPATIGNYVWDDLNGNGLQDSGEPGIPNVSVLLTGTTGDGDVVSLSTTTDGGGLYLFTGLEPGTYKLTFTKPSGYSATQANVGANDGADSDADETTGMTVNTTLTSGEDDRSWDAGYFKPAKLGDYVWNDLDGDGVQDSGEPGISGVAVQLTGTTGDGQPVTLNTTTDGTGFYQFTGLEPGTYKVTFTKPSGYSATAANQGANDGLDSDASESTGMTGNYTLISGQDEPTVDAGFFQPATIGNFAWNDLNANGLQDSGEPGIQNVTVQLTGTTGDGQAVSLTTTTDVNGLYLFTGLEPGTYKLTFSTPAGFTVTYRDKPPSDGGDSDIDPATGMTVNTTLTSGEDDRSWDGGYYVPARLGDFVWNDLDGDGVQDSGEPGIPGVVVTLTGNTGDGTPVTLTATTNASGIYDFPSLVPGTYKITVAVPSGYSVSTPD